ncbi:unnamed protein product [Spirodela intermedia]|uniref:Serine/threonine-protein phosphatase n=1 Tax=Spirodela intermedia TaxID=51605 RepID=A0A7I8IVZ6_SPIIN|nr:unnamed protein product [Spirodela intermedia]CAA6662038.1 unnamed protein product [Spirodela intermedia]
MDKRLLDDIISRLLVGGSECGKQVKLSEAEIRTLCVESRRLFLSQPNLLQLSAPIKICAVQPRGIPPASKYLFLGDYVDRGKFSLETICLLLAYKLKYPEGFFLLRGNHEDAKINRIYGFYDECKRRFNVRLWKTFTDCFNCLPAAALIDGRILCMHGGISPDLKSLQQIEEITRPTDVPDCGLLEDAGWAAGDRGVSFSFGADILSEFLTKLDLDLICRGHQVVEDGYEFFGERRLVTIFSAPNYCGEFDNAGALLSIDETLTCSFEIIKPPAVAKSASAKSDGKKVRALP